MGRWNRTSLSKSRSFSAGEMLHVLCDDSALKENKVNEELYGSLLKLTEHTQKAFALHLTAILLALLAYFDVLEKASAAGLEVTRAAFRPVALSMYSLSFFYFGVRMSKMSYLQAWFGHLFDTGNARTKAALLLRYPDAFWYFYFYSGARGYPKDLFPKRIPFQQIIPIFLIVALLLIAFVASIAIWLALASSVWRSAFPSAFWAGSTIFASGVLMLLGFTLPQNHGKREFVHYGLVNLLQRVPEEKRVRAFNRINAARRRMGMIE